MSIFGIIALSLLAGVMMGLIYCVITICMADSDWGGHFVIAAVVCLAVLIGGVFLGIGLTTEYEQTYIAKYEAQKVTIEASLQSEAVGSLERAQLVNQAAALNGELAERRAMFDRWHYVTFDDTIYDNVEFINLN